MTSVSIIIPYYNQGRYLQSAVQSCLAACSSEIEVIIVDDGSTEGHANHYLANAQKLGSNVRTLRKANGGLSSARNTGIANASGDFIQLLDCDDVLVPGKIDYQIQQFLANPEAKVSVSGYYTSNDWLWQLKDESQSIIRYPFVDEAFLFHWERGFSIPIHSGLFHRSVFKTISFNEDLYGKEDWIFWTTLAGDYPGKFLYCPVIGAVYRLHQQGMTRAVDRMGESWINAAEILGRRFSSNYPQFLDSAKHWHQTFYNSARLQKREERCLKPQNKEITTFFEATTTRPKASLISESRQPSAACKISFIVPVFNHKEYLSQCIQSILEQSIEEDIEIIAIDDRSTESGIVDALKEIKSERVRYCIYQNDANYGISVTQNLAAELAHGRYIAFVDCDDFLSRDALEAILEVIDSRDDDYIFTDRNHVDSTGKLIEVAKYGGYSWLRPSGSIEDDLMLGMVASHLKVIKKESYISVGGSDTEYSGIQDWELALRFIGKGSFHYIPLPIYNHRIHNGSVSTSGATSQIWMTNLLRRKYMFCLEAGPVRPLTIEIDRLSVSQVKFLSDQIKKGTRFRYRSSSVGMSGEDLNILREFNSLFDEIIVDERLGAALMGYLWEKDALIIDE